MFLKKIKRRTSFVVSLNRLRAYSRLVKSGEGETQIWSLITLLVNRPDVPLAIRQKLIQNTMDHDLAAALMLVLAGNKNPILLRLPGQWRRFMKSHGAVVHWASPLLWYIDLLRKYRVAWIVYKNLLKNRQAYQDNCAVLIGLHDNATITQSDIVPVNFLTWFQESFNYSVQWVQKSGNTAVDSDHRIIFSDFSFPKLSLREKVTFSKKATQYIFSAFLKAFYGRWHDSYMLPDLIEKAYVEALPTYKLAKLYGFTVAQHAYRPLWTYTAEDKGAEIAMFFYSTNNFDFQLIGRPPNGVVPSFTIMNWPVIYTQSHEHKNFVEQVMNKKAIIYCDKLIPYEDSAKHITLAGKIKISYLDVQPFRPAFMASIGRPCHFYTEKYSLQALNDIVEVVGSVGGTLNIKPKRAVGKKLSKNYLNAINALQNSNTVQLIDPGVSPARLFKETDIVICQPFTSAALYARQAKKPVIYYDAVSFFEKEQPAAQNIPILQGKQELQLWLQKIIHESQAAA